MSPFVAFDLARFFVAPFYRVPRGIDRVETGLARHFLGHWPGDCVATLPTPWGTRCISRGRALRLVEAANEAWGEMSEHENNAEATFLRLKRQLLGRAKAGP